MYLIAFPLLLLPFAFFNIVIFLLKMPLDDTVFSIPLVSEPVFPPVFPPVFDREMPVTLGELLVIVGMLLLYVEIVKAARPGGKGVMDHLLSFLVFVAMAAELALVERAATPTLLLLTVLGFVDTISGLSIRPVYQQVVLERPERAQV
jgi:hypothetical protein